mmetsp:Transcript_29055/g.79748  ORF Transcript_29055/g.79748 Transcript_29055/m.79748 type:complete len:211 (+) Transcript_29055:2518-3150(+)
MLRLFRNLRLNLFHPRVLFFLVFSGRLNRLAMLGQFISSRVYVFLDFLNLRLQKSVSLLGCREVIRTTLLGVKSLDRLFLLAPLLLGILQFLFREFPHRLHILQLSFCFGQLRLELFCMGPIRFNFCLLLVEHSLHRVQLVLACLQCGSVRRVLFASSLDLLIPPFQRCVGDRKNRAFDIPNPIVYRLDIVVKLLQSVCQVCLSFLVDLC